tara:strand:+ start:12525 stop:12848 length:324 start_codon:yes stop_codon:yes gene_type:complete
MIVKHEQADWTVRVYNGIPPGPTRNSRLRINCKLEGQDLERWYEIPEGHTEVNCSGEYTFVTYPDCSFYSIKCQDDSTLVIDKWFLDEDQDPEMIGCHDFWDDVEID